MTTKEHRKPIPLGVKLHACMLLLDYPDWRIRENLRRGRHTVSMKVRLETMLRELRFTDEDIAAGLNWDHSPPLGLRAVVNGVMTPAPNDPHHLVPLRPADHAVKTRGSKATAASGDIHKIAKVKRLNGTTKKKPKRAWASRKFQLRSR